MHSLINKDALTLHPTAAFQADYLFSIYLFASSGIVSLLVPDPVAAGSHPLPGGPPAWSIYNWVGEGQQYQLKVTPSAKKIQLLKFGLGLNHHL